MIDMHAAYFVKCELLNVGLLLQAAIQLHSSRSSAVDSVTVSVIQILVLV